MPDSWIGGLRIALILTIVFAFLSHGAPSQGLQPVQSDQTVHSYVRSVHVTSGADATIVVVEVTGQFRFRFDRLHNPERVYFDLVDTVPDITSRPFYREKLDDKLLSQIRVAATAQNATRLVLDLVGDLLVTTSQTANPYRLVIELRTKISALASTTAASPEKSTLWGDATARIETPQSSDSRSPSDRQLDEGSQRTSIPALGRLLALKVMRIVIDPGHGGHDPGAEGAGGSLEKDFVLDIAKRLAKLVTIGKGWDVISTRSDDTFIAIGGRAALANEQKADLFVSIHASALPRPGDAGGMVHPSHDAEHRAAVPVAPQVDPESPKTILELQEIVRRLTNQQRARQSRDLADFMQEAIADGFKNVRRADRAIVETNAVDVLDGCTMPAVVVEVWFPNDLAGGSYGERMAEYRQKMAQAIFKGMADYSAVLTYPLKAQ